MSISKGKIIAGLVALLVIAGGLFYAYNMALLHLWSYSKGDRVGFVQKMSNKGNIINTWEGEMVMTPIPGAIPEKFLFSVRDTELAKRIDKIKNDKRLVLTYEQHKGVSKVFGETEYFITDAKLVE